MKIASQLPQFKEGVVVLLVSGAQDAIIYTAGNGVITRQKRITIKQLKYSDREGFYATRTNARTGKGVLRVGSVRERNKWQPREEFMKELAAYLVELQRTVVTNAIFVFAPSYIGNELKQHLPPRLRRMIAKTFAGEFTHMRPFGLLEKIAGAKPSPVSVLRTDVKKILNRKNP